MDHSRGILPLAVLPLAVFQSSCDYHVPRLVSTFVPSINPEIQLVLANSLADAYAAAFAYVYYAALVVGGAALVAALFLKHYDEYFTGHVPRQAYKPGE